MVTHANCNFTLLKFLKFHFFFLYKKLSWKHNYRWSHTNVRPPFLPPTLHPPTSTRGCIFLQLSRQFKQSAYLFRECLAAPLVHVLGNTIWPQVPFVYLKPSVSARLLPVLIVSRVSSHFTSTLIMWGRRKGPCLERSGWDFGRGWSNGRCIKPKSR